MQRKRSKIALSNRNIIQGTYAILMCIVVTLKESKNSYLVSVAEARWWREHHHLECVTIRCTGRATAAALRLPSPDVCLCKPGYPAWRKPKYNWSAKAKNTKYHWDWFKETPEPCDADSGMSSMKEWHVNWGRQLLQRPVHPKDFSDYLHNKRSVS